MLKNYGIPNDSLDQRMEVFMRLMTPDPKTGHMDGVGGFQLLVPYGKEKSVNEKLWIAIYYSLSYSASTAIRMFEEFPCIDSWDKFEDYWYQEKPTLVFGSDRKYVKNNNQVMHILKDIWLLSNGGELDKYVLPLFQQGFESIYNTILQKWYGYGPMGAYLFFDAVYGLLPEVYVDPIHLDWKHSGQTVVEGMAHLLGNDEAIDTKEYDLNKFNDAVEQIVKLTKQPKILLESELCMFRKLFKATRYYGFYADRELEEYIKVDDILKKYYNVDIWKLRELTCKDELRGEVHGWEGIQKFMRHDFLNTGKLRCSLEVMTEWESHR